MRLALLFSFIEPKYVLVQEPEAAATAPEAAATADAKPNGNALAGNKRKADAADPVNSDNCSVSSCPAWHCMPADM